MAQVSFAPTRAFFPAIISGCLLILTYVCLCVYTYMCIHRMEYYSAIKKSEMMPFVATWIYLEIFILSEVSQRKEKDEYNTALLTCGI